MPEEKRVVVEGVEVAIVGRPGDPYFDHLGEANDNALLAGAIGRLPHDAVIFDVGANMGVTTALFAKLIPDATIFSFEPDPEPFGYLQATIRANGFSRAQPINKALGAEPGQMSFLHNTGSAGASHLITGQTLGKNANEVVSVSTVDLEMKALDLPRLDFIKIDVEGFETDVLAGARATLAQHRPDIVLEFNSFTMMAFRNLYPRAFLERLIAEFPYVYRYPKAAGRFERVNTKAEQVGFIHDNLIYHGCVDDLLCTWRPIA
jgi:FkbM family methyltransferase